MNLKKYLKICLHKKGQSTLEYVLILAAVIGAIVAGGVIFKPNLTSVYTMIYPTAYNPGTQNVRPPQ